MLKKIIVYSLVGLGIGYFIFGQDLLGYIRTLRSYVVNNVKSEIPIEFEVSRAKDTVQQLLPQIHDSMHIIAEQQVEIEHLTVKLSRKAHALEKQRRTILTMRTRLEENQDQNFFVIQGNSYSKNEIEHDLSKRFERFKIAEETLKHEQKFLEARTKMLDANQKKLAGLISEKKDLELQLAELEARMKTVQAAETVSELALNDSDLGRAKQLINELNKRLDVKERLLDQEGQYTDLIPYEEESVNHSNLKEEIDDYFDSNLTDYRNFNDSCKMAGCSN